MDEDEYILKLSRYVHLNPVFVKAYAKEDTRERINILRGYAWSSYRSYIGLGVRLDFVDYEPILTMMGRPKKKQPATYRRFVEAGIRNIDAAFIETKRCSRFCIGSDERKERAQDMYLDRVQRYATKEDVSFRRIGSCGSTEKVLAVCQEVLGISRDALTRRRKNSSTRALIALVLCQYAGCTQRQAAEVLGLSSGAAVSIQLKKLQTQLKSDRPLKASFEQLTRRLSEMR